MGSEFEYQEPIGAYGINLAAQLVAYKFGKVDMFQGSIFFLFFLCNKCVEVRSLS